MNNLTNVKPGADSTANPVDAGLGVAGATLFALGAVGNDRRAKSLQDKVAALTDRNRLLSNQLSDTQRQLSDALERAESAEHAMNVFVSSTDAVRSTVLGTMCRTLNFSELAPFGGLRPGFGVSAAELPGSIFFRTVGWQIALVTAYIEQFGMAARLSNGVANIVLSRQRFEDALSQMTDGLSYGVRVFVDKPNWSQARKLFAGDGFLFGRVWTIAGGVSPLSLKESGGIYGAMTVSEFAKNVGRRTTPPVKFERSAALCERGRTNIVTTGSWQWLYASPSFWAWCDAIRAAASGVGKWSKPYNDIGLLEALSVLTPVQVFALMPSYMLRVAEILGISTPAKFSYGVVNCTSPFFMYGYTYHVPRTSTSTADIRDKLVALAQEDVDLTVTRYNRVKARSGVGTVTF